MTRLLRNLVLIPTRTLASIQRRRDPAFRHRNLAIRYAKQHLTPKQIEQLAAVPGNSSAWQCMLLFYLAEHAAQTTDAGQLVEIGAFKGKSTAWLAQAARRTKRHLVSIDPLIENTEAVFRQTVQAFDIESVATLHQAFSHDVAKNWDAPIAFLWIDGGHDYDCVKQDVMDFTPHVVPGGWVVFDDVNPDGFPGLIRALRETIDQDQNFERIGLVKNTGLYRRRTP